MTRRKRAFWLILSVGLASLDLWSKALWEYGDVGGARRFNQVVFDGWLQISTIWNTGGVWSLPLAQGILTWTTWIALPLVAVWIFWPEHAGRVETAGKAMILGGAVGNLYDRVRWGAVRDFIDVYFGDIDGWHWPTFNVADMSLVCGICLLLVIGMRKPSKAPGEAAA